MKVPIRHGRDYLDDAVHAAEHVLRELKRVGVSNYARDEVTNEIRGGNFYNGTVLVEGEGSTPFLAQIADKADQAEQAKQTLREQQSEQAWQTEQQVKDAEQQAGQAWQAEKQAVQPEQARGQVERADPDADADSSRGAPEPAPPVKYLDRRNDPSTEGLMSAACMRSFSEATKNVPIDAVVRVRCRYFDRVTGHLVVFGPGGFQLCTCLRLLRRGLPCPHVFTAFFQLSRLGDFSGECVHPRWRSSGGPWSVCGAGLAAAAVNGRGGRVVFRDGFTPDFEELEVEEEMVEEYGDEGDHCGVVAAPAAAAAERVSWSSTSAVDGAATAAAAERVSWSSTSAVDGAATAAAAVADGYTGLGDPPLPTRNSGGRQHDPITLSRGCLPAPEGHTGLGHPIRNAGGKENRHHDINTLVRGSSSSSSSSSSATLVRGSSSSSSSLATPDGCPRLGHPPMPIRDSDSEGGRHQGCIDDGEGGFTHSHDGGGGGGPSMKRLKTGAPTEATLQEAGDIDVGS